MMRVSRKGVIPAAFGRRSSLRLLSFAIIALALGLVFRPLPFEPQPVSGHTIQTTLRAGNSNKCLAIGDHRNGAVAFQWTCGSENNIEVVDAGSGWHYIKFLHSGKCLTVNGNASWDGATLDQWDCLGQANQRWGGAFNQNGGFDVHSSELNPTQCLTVDGNALWDGAAVNQWRCLAQGILQANQIWQAVAAE